MTTLQLKHNEIRNIQHVFPITIICDNISSADNVGLIFRVCEAFGVKEIILCGNTVQPPNHRLEKASRNTFKKVGFRCQNSARECVLELKEEGFQILALEVTNSSCPLRQYKHDSSKKIALIAGNEKHGIEANLLDLCDKSISIDMFGTNTSMNVAMALSVTLYEITKQLLQD